MNGVISPSSGGGGATLTAGYPVQTPSQLATHALPPEHTSAVAPQFAGHLFTYLLACLLSVCTNFASASTRIGCR